MSGMMLLKPIEITGYTTNIPENDYPEYNPATTYALDERVIVSSTHSVFESVSAGNLGNTPVIPSTFWNYVGSTNAYKSIDQKVSTQTIGSGTMTFEFPTLKATAIAFLNVECSTIKVEILDGTTVIFSEERNGFSRNVTGWYSYLFEDFEYRNFFLFEHLLNPFATYRITLTGTTCKLGIMVRGTMFAIGTTKWGLQDGFIDYSTKEYDRWGELSLKEGNVRDYMKSEIFIQTSRLPIVKKVLKERRGKLSLFIPTVSKYELAVYGNIVEPELIYENGSISCCTFDIQGVI